MERTRNATKVKTGVAIALFAIAAILSAVFMGRVAINYNIADYLGDDTQTKIALDLIEKEFGSTGNIQVMVKNVSEDEAKNIKKTIKSINNVITVNFDETNSAYYSDGNALFIVVTDGDDYSDSAKTAAEDIKNALKNYNAEYGGTTIEKAALQQSITGEMGYILAVALCLVVGILLITSESWLEPFVLLLSSGVAVLINRGTNVFFGEISYITNSIAAILQLALSIDYSIVLLHAYRNKKREHEDCGEAMFAAVKSVAQPVSASALTTIAGLLALLFMSFRIGFDIGMVLMKGIVISAVTSLTLLPALVLAFDKLMKKTRKKSFVPKGEFFCKTAEKAGKFILPIALVVVIVCGILQGGNVYTFTDSKSGNAEITKEFGSNNTVAVVYKNTSDNYAAEQRLIKALNEYKTASGNAVLKDYSARSNTVGEIYDEKTLASKLSLTENEAEMLLAMYNIYKNPSVVTATFGEFVDYALNLTRNDEDAAEFASAQTVETLEKLKKAANIAENEQTSSELYANINDLLNSFDEENTSAEANGDGEKNSAEKKDISEFSVAQIYGLYFYDDVENPAIDFLTTINYIISVSSDENFADVITSDEVAELQMLSTGISMFNAQMQADTEKSAFKYQMANAYGINLSDEEVEAIYAGYFAYTGEPVASTAKYLPLFTFAVSSGAIANQQAVADVTEYNKKYVFLNGSYKYDEFPVALATAAEALAGQAPEKTLDENSAKQIYISYFYSVNAMPAGKMSGKTFAEFALASAETNPLIASRLSEENKNSLTDIITINKYFADNSSLNYLTAFDKINVLQTEIKSEISSANVGKDEVSGVFIKLACFKEESGAFASVEAGDLLDFVTGNMDENILLKRKMTDEKREKVNDSQADASVAEALFTAENYSRMLLTVDLPNESDETSAFVKDLSVMVEQTFGDDAYIAGEIVSTYDLEQSFAHDNSFITVFTLVSIFIIVAVIFKSLSVPVILVAVIQGAIFIAMSTQLFGDGIFFMSYIVTTCILMGATIDYGILTSSNYVSSRRTLDKREALKRSLNASMPTVFTSGLILTVCGFVIHFISSQNSISTVGLLLGIGTICSVIMILFVLPSVLYYADKFVLFLSLHVKNKEKSEKIKENDEK